MKIIELLKVSELEIDPNGIQIFSKTLNHLFKMEEAMLSSLEGFVMKRIWISWKL